MVFAVCMLLLVVGQAAPPTTARHINLVLPRPLNPSESALLEVTLGAVERGSEVEILTAEGHIVGGISPYGVQSRHEAGTYLLPVPPEAISHDRISLLISLRHDGNPPRAPTMDEVKSVKVKIVPATLPRK